MTQKKSMQEIEARNKKTVIQVFLVVFLMVGMAFASVPAYNLFCRVTGFNGTTGVSDGAQTAVLDRTVNIRFYTATSSDMPWEFESETPNMELNVGKQAFANFKASNPTNQAIVGTAIYNVTPLKAGKYFKKVQCFCFDEQRLNPGQSVNMPVMFYVDPKMNEDPNLQDVKTITLSYTFFRKDTITLEDAAQAASGISG